MSAHIQELEGEWMRHGMGVHGREQACLLVLDSHHF